MTEPVPFAHLDREALDFQLSPSRSARDPWGVLARHEAESAAPGVPVARDLAHGAAPRAKLDLYRPEGDGPFPCLAFIHGGFWQEGSMAGSGFAARALAARGWALAGIGYTLAPEARLTGIVAEIAAALAFLRTRPEVDPARLVVAGHSAGGHLAACMLAGMGGDQPVAGAVLVSGVYDLAPVAASYVNDRARIDAGEVAALSPLFARPARDVPVHVVVGADEPEAFLAQSRALAAAWRPHLTRLTVHEAPGRDHFDVLDELADPGSPTFAALLSMGER